MHVLHLIKTSEGATWAVKMLQHLKTIDKDVTITVLIPKGGKHFDEYQQICDHVIEFNFDLNFNLFKNGWKLRKIVKKAQPDLIHSWFTQTTLFMRFFLYDFKIKKVFQVVGPSHLENSLFKFFDVFSANKYDYWIPTSQYIYNKYISYNVSKDKLYVNYPYCDLQALEALKKTNSIHFRDDFKIDSDVKIIGTASYIYPPKFYEKTGIKGHELLIDAVEILLKKGKKVKLIIAGTTFGNNFEYEEKLKKYASEKLGENVFFTGKYNNVYAVMSNFDVFVYLSKSENMGGVFESLFFKIPTVSSDRGALPELVINQETGYLVGLDDINQIANQIDIALYNNTIDLNKGEEIVKQKFNQNNIAVNAINIYKKILS